MEKDKHRNKHRAGKKQVLIFLPPEEAALIEAVKAHTGAGTYRELLVLLCRGYQQPL